MMGVAKRDAERTVSHVARDGAKCRQGSRAAIVAKTKGALRGTKWKMETRLAVILLARDPNVTYRQAGREHGVDGSVVYKATRLIPELREERRHRQRGAQ